MNRSPLLSVVIPTYKRPQFLLHAVNSALKAAPDGDVEVIVVPNGPDESWKGVAEQFGKNRKVCWRPVSMAHANVARNHGMSMARGEYIRFLDDDDYFYPESAQAQLIHLMNNNGDLSFADIEYIDLQDVRNNRILHQIKTDDYYSAALSPTHATATTALVYRRLITEGLAWDVSVNKNQDVYWAMLLCKKNDMKTVRFDGVVGAWIQHSLPRVSKGHHPARVSKETAQHILGLTASLSCREMLSKQRAEIASEHLWKCLHRGLMYEPLYWIKISSHARKLSLGRNPGIKIYQFSAVKKINPLLVELSLIPWRWIKVLYKKIF